MTAVLWHIEISHYNEKARWALDYKGVPHRRRAPLPGATAPFALALTRGRQRRLPVLQLDGETVGDSTAIIAALERTRPEPPLYPADPDQRARALELEEFFDEQLAPEIRRFVWHHTLGDARATAATVATGSRVKRAAVRALVPLARPAIRLDYQVSKANALRAQDCIHAAMDRVEDELRHGGGSYLVGDRFGVADLTAAALFTPVICPPERQYPPPSVAPAIRALREELLERPGGVWVSEMYARHRGTSAEIG